ncbi:MAG: NAD(P)H-hydrate dehydratase, partial [Methyloceanibacter sp.]
VEYIKTFSPRFAATNEERLATVSLGAAPARNEAALAEGKALFTKLACITCHGEAGHGDGSSAAALVDDNQARIKPRAFANEPALWLARFPWPQPASHKYARGHAVVVSGPVYTTGAARLGARGALRVGAGLVTVASPKDALEVTAAQLTAIMVRPVDDATELVALLADERKNAVMLGPGAGVGERLRAMVLAALKSDAAVVLDADALTSFAGDADTLFAAIKSRAAPVVLTPHDGEFTRLFGPLGEGSKLEQARGAAKHSGAILVLKGADTVVAAPDGRASINATTSPWLATAGTGDVLAGMVAGMLAQRMAAFEGACAAVWMHGAAARAYGPGLIAEDVPEILPKVLRDLSRLAERPVPTGDF